MNHCKNMKMKKKAKAGAVSSKHKIRTSFFFPKMKQTTTSSCVKYVKMFSYVHCKIVFICSLHINFKDNHHQRICVIPSLHSYKTFASFEASFSGNVSSDSFHSDIRGEAQNAKVNTPLNFIPQGRKHDSSENTKKIPSRGLFWLSKKVERHEAVEGTSGSWKMEWER